MNGDRSLRGKRVAPAHTWSAQLAWAEATISAAGLPSPRLDALTLLMHLVHAPPGLLESQPWRSLESEEVARYSAWARRRAAGESVAYITGHTTFMGLDLLVDRRVALVQSNTVRFVEAALEVLRARPPGKDGALLVAEIGTGCGALTLALGLLEPRIGHLYAVDSSIDALVVARANGRRYVLDLLISWLEGNTLDPIPEPVDLIVANLPYLRRGLEQAVPGALDDEPPVLLRSEEKEPAQMRTLIAQAPAKLRPGGALLLALEDLQIPAVVTLLGEVLPTAHIWSGPSQKGGDSLAVAQLPRA